MFSHAAGRQEHCKHHWLVWGGSQCLGCTGFAPTHCVCAFPVYTAQPPGCSAGNCLKQTLGCMHFPGLSHSGSGAWVLHKGADSVGPAFCALTGPSSSGDQVAWLALSPQVCGASYHIPIPAARCPGCAAGISAGVPCVSSGELISGCDTPGGCQLSRSPGRLG